MRGLPLPPLSLPRPLPPLSLALVSMEKTAVQVVKGTQTAVLPGPFLSREKLTLSPGTVTFDLPVPPTAPAFCQKLNSPRR